MEVPTGPEKWADLIRHQLYLLAPYNESDEQRLSVAINETVMEAPRRRGANTKAKLLAKAIAKILYPYDADGSEDAALVSIIKYEECIVKLRRHVVQKRKRDHEIVTARNEMKKWSMRVLKQGEWDPATDLWPLTGAPSLPMPVEIAEPQTLEPFFEHLRLGGTDELSSTVRTKEATRVEEENTGTQTLAFPKGIVYSDRRMDLCKMVLGPRNIGDLIESLRTNEFITHFLLGNNIIGPHGSECIANFLKEFPNRMDTWYLAGNCIDRESFKLLVDEWVKSDSVTNIWLKRNPLSPSAAEDIYRLITQTRNLRTLDLDQTELGDEGVAVLFDKLTSHATISSLPLRHIYLNAVGIGEKGAAAISSYLASPNCTLNSLYVNNNPLGSRGGEALAMGLKANKSLQRLTLASTGMGDRGVIALFEALRNHPSLMAFDVGQSYATEDLGSR